MKNEDKAEKYLKKLYDELDRFSRYHATEFVKECFDLPHEPVLIFNDIAAYPDEIDYTVDIYDGYRKVNKKPVHIALRHDGTMFLKVV